MTPEKMASALAPKAQGFQEIPGEATITAEELYRRRVAMVPLQGESAAGATCESVAPDAETSAVLGFYRRRKKPSSAQLQSMSPALEDMVKICTYAGRQQAGGLVWLSWCGGSGEK